MGQAALCPAQGMGLWAWVQMLGGVLGSISYVECMLELIFNYTGKGKETYKVETRQY